MAAYEPILELLRDYFSSMGYNNNYLKDYFSGRIFVELLSIRLANANVCVRNKTDRKSHQSHIAITGEATHFFYTDTEFKNKDNITIEKKPVRISVDNIKSLNNSSISIDTPLDLELIDGVVTVGKRTQNQVQLSKKNSENSECFNTLRLGLFENDLLILLKYRETDCILAVGIPQIFYLDYIPNYANKYETNTYLRLPRIQN